MPIGASPYHLVFIKAWNFSIELDHKTSWVVKRLNLPWNDVVMLRLNQLNEIDEFYVCANKSLALCKNI